MKSCFFLETIKYPENLTCYMKWSLIILSLLLLLPLTQAVYEDILGTTEAYLVDDGELYFKKPHIAYEGSLFEMSLLPDINETNIEIDIDLYKDGKLLEKTFSTIDFEGETKILIIWSDALTEDTNYKLTYEKNGKRTFEQEFVVLSKEKIVVDRLLKETVYIPQVKTDNQREYLIDFLKESNFDYDLDKFIREENSARAFIDLDKKVFIETLVYNDNSTAVRTVIVIDLKSEKNFQYVRIIETIPKDFAAHVSELTSSDEFTVLEEDPIIMWHIENMDEKRIQYSVQGNATLTGNTILLTSVDAETDGVDLDKKSSANIVFPLLMIPLVAGIIIFFSKFSKSRTKSKRKKY